MEVDRKYVDTLRRFDHCVRVGARTLDVLFVPTSLVRTVMRREDEHLQLARWTEIIFQGRYPPKSRARWITPVAYAIAGVGETARFVGYGFLAYELIKNLVN